MHRTQWEFSDGVFEMEPSQDGLYKAYRRLPATLRDYFSASLSRLARRNRSADDFLVYYEDGVGGGERRAWTMPEVVRAGEALSSLLASAAGGFEIGQVVACFSANAPEYVATLVACGSVGVACACLNSFWVASEVAWALDHCAARAVVVDALRLARLEECGVALPTTLRDIFVIDRTVPAASRAAATLQHARVHFFTMDTLLASNLVQTQSLPVVRDDLALLCFTSGTTSRPKGVPVTHTMMLQACWHMLAGAETANMTNPSTSLAYVRPANLLPVPLFHMTGLLAGCLACFALGRKVVVMRRWDPGEALRLIQNERITFFVGVPTMAAELIGHRDWRRYDVSSLHLVGGGGAMTPAQQVEAISAAVPGGCWNGYGLTETVGGFARIAGQEYARRPLSCGKPSPLVKVKIDEATQEIRVKGVTVMKGYWRLPDTDGSVFDSEGYFRTGDTGYLDAEGYLFVTGRIKELIIRGGEKISTYMVEEVLYQHPFVKEVGVIPFPDERLGEIVLAVVCLKDPAATLTLADVQAFCKGKMASFAVPEMLHIWRSPGGLPRGATEKIQKRDILLALSKANIKL